MFRGGPNLGCVKGGLSLLLFALVFLKAEAEILIPPYFNLAEGRRITATATCGDEEAELYCKLVGANAENDEHINVIQGQVCDFCDLNNPSKRHPPEFAVDGMETWWQSPPLSRGMKYNEVNLTIDLGQEFHVAYVFVRMGNSPRPRLWALEKSSDHGKTYKPWQYFSDSASDCETYFGKESLLPITRDDSVTCNLEYSKIVPLENGEIPISLLNNRPSANKYFNSSVLQEWTRATNVRLRFVQTKTLLGHLMSVARQDPTVTRRYFYSIKDVSIGGRCMCNGHADTCDIPDQQDPNKLLCRCQHHTCGPQCAYCCPGFEQKAWRQSQLWQRFVCEPCNCFHHSNECKYDANVDAQRLSLDIHGNYEGGGVCQNCQHNTEGINCNKCKEKFYRPYRKHWNETDVCQPCECQYSHFTGNCAEGTGQCECRKEYKRPLCDDCSYGYFGYPDCKPCTCNLNGTEGDFCEPSSFDERCPCKFNYAGIHCEQCSDGYYNFPTCEECACNQIGSLTSACEQQSGNCTCKNNFSGRTCDHCEAGFYNYPSCKYCNCDRTGTLTGICNATSGECLCKEGFGGPRCDQCIPGYYSELHGPEQVCEECRCSEQGSTTTSCDAGTGKCTCLYNFGGKQCDQCSPGYYKYPECQPCSCDSVGSIGISCDIEGQCKCKGNFDTTRCNVCKEGFYNFPVCEDCNCDPAGVVQAFAGCGSVPDGELCECKERVQGRICNECRPLFWDLQQHNPLGCIDCECYIPGTQGGIGVCDTKSGLCTCKYAVGERSCHECLDGSYNLTQENIFGCVDCGCDVGGSVNNICDKTTGQCTCKPRVNGLRCNEPLNIHYFPTLHQYQYEAEDATTPSGSPVRYDYAEHIFPDFSWKGYANFSSIHNQINQNIYIQKPSLYRMVLRYVNPSGEPIIGKVIIKPENLNEIEQRFDVLLKPTTSPQFVTVSGAQGTIPSPLVMDPGNWLVIIKIDNTLYLDYFALVPAAYYEATILSQKVDSVCHVGDRGLCRHFGYPDISSFDTVKGAGGFTSRNGVRDPIYQYIDYRQQLKELKEPEIPLVDKMQEELLLDLRVSRTGPHVMLIEYVTPVDNGDAAGGSVTITARGSVSQEYSKVFLNSCPYTFACRQVLLDESNKVHIFNIQDNFVGLSLKGDNETSVGIKSVVVIPYSHWHQDYIKPQPICVRKNEKCIQSEFPVTPDSKKVEFKSTEETSKNLPLNIYDNTTDLVYLNADNLHFDVASKVPSPGQYVFIVHYYQPDYPEFDLNVIIQNGQIYEATLPIKHCPSNSGCRSVVQMPETNLFGLTENFLLTAVLEWEAEKKAVWLDYLMVVPADHYMESIMSEKRHDQTREFISTCGNNHFHVNITSEGFCRDAVFSLTSDYNNGASSCNCDYMGSLSFECHPFGGQCHCRPNVIGRQCQACKTGFYGFPDCKPCDCPSTAYCEKETGECICPSGVTGERCDHCLPYTYGFDPIVGCENCNCDPLGVVENRLQCDISNGTCQCKPNVVGRTCDHCTSGHYAFPYCQQCKCDSKGTTPEICDQVTAECYCKSNVHRQYCDVCKEGNFDLQEDNEAGCTKCFCFGKTTRCSSANLYWSEIVSMENWSLANIVVSQNVSLSFHSNAPKMLNPKVIGVELGNKYINDIVYFGAPAEYLSNKLTSYGGILQYSLFYTTGQYGSAVGQADVILKGADIWLIHSSIEQPPATENWIKQLDIRETQFKTLTGLPATRELLMTVLEDLQGLYIRATYWKSSITTRLQEVSLQYGVDMWSDKAEKATSVEDCQCPGNYQGYSCEECAEGYYRVSTGPHGGVCVPCQCNGHAETCDVNTGICINCQHFTQGDHCDQCIEGYHGNALSGTPNDCLICACPLPVMSNNFATSCEVSSDGEHITCECKDGYFGARCESCRSGFYGTPQQLGQICKPCECSGNINPEDPYSCDTVTGDCLKCMNNTWGDACGLCEPGYYGDAVILKDCQVCLCDTVGMERCDSYSGTCVCREGVVGDKCDRCENEHWGFESGEGCRACDCSIASQSKQCDDNTGQCKCMPGVTRKNCDRCASGFWNYSESGCITCECNTGYSIGLGCNAKTGHCECLPGVIGDKCDHCPYRNVLIPSSGCEECDSCVHNLLDSTDHLQNLINASMVEFQDVYTENSPYFTTQRLFYISNQTNQIKPLIAALDPDKFDLSATSRKIESLEANATSLNRKADFAVGGASKLKDDAGELLNQCNFILKDVSQGIVKSKAMVEHVWDLAQRLETSAWPHVDAALSEAKQILSDLKDKDLSPYTNASQTQLDNTQNLVEKIKVFLEPVGKQSQDFNKLRDLVSGIDNKLNDIVNYTKIAHKRAEETEALNNKNRAAQISSKLDLVNSEKKESEKDLKLASEYLANARYAKNDASKFVDAAGRELNEGFMINNLVNSTVLKLSTEMSELGNVLDQANDHMVELLGKSKQLNDLYERSKNNSKTEHAVRGASAYPDIVREINASEEAATEAALAIEQSTNLTAGLADRVAISKANSTNLHQEAYNALGKVQSELKNQLDIAEQAVKDVKSTNQLSEDANSAIIASLSNIPEMSLAPYINKAKQDSAQAIEMADEVKGIMNQLSQTLPDSLRQAEELPKDVDETIKSLDLIRKSLDSVNQTRPNIANLRRSVEEKQQKLEERKRETEDNIEKLRKAIAMAKDLANRIKVGVQFETSTTLQLKPPDNVEELSTSTHVSAYFKTEKENGFLMYLGNEEGTKLRRTKSDDFMALEIVKGFPTLTMNIGDRPVKITNDKYVANGVWYQVIVDRVGKNVELTIREELVDSERKYVTKDVLPGSHTIFNLDKDQSKLFVGGYPNAFNVQADVEFSSFEGQIEDLVIGDTPVGLWNFVDAQGNNKGARERDKLVNQQPNTGYRFDGEGYAILDSQSYRMQEKSDIQFKFKTFAKEGLLFFAGKGKTFLSIEMREGKVFFQYRLGGNVLTIGSIDTYNDGRWHSLAVVRDRKVGLMKIDEKDIETNEADGEQVLLQISDQMFFGGYPNRHGYDEVTNVGFDGCIDEVIVSETIVDLSQNLQAFGVTPGCPVKFARLVSFEPNSQGYIRRPNASSSNLFQLTLKFKTTVKEGLIFYVTNRDQSAGISLSLVNGSLVALSQKEQLTTGSNQYNDDQWHVVTTTHDDNSLRIVIDDFDDYGSDRPLPKLHFMYGDLFIGGVPSNYVITPLGTATKKSFVGCLGDATINGAIINFANATDKNGETLGRCSKQPKAVSSGVIHSYKPIEHITKATLERVAVPATLPTKSPAPDIGREFKPKQEATQKPTPQKKVTVPDARTKRPPPSTDNCAYGTASAGRGNLVNGFRFGSRSDSRVEFEKLPARYKNSFDFAVEFNTTSDGGVIFYAADSSHKDFVTLFMRDGKIHFGFNSGSGPARLVTEQTYNDGDWHSVVFSREQLNGKLTIDNVLVAEGKSQGSSSSLIMQAPFYLGGIANVSTDIRYNLQNYYSPFNGCIRDFTMNNQPVTDIKTVVAAASCDQKFEKGIHFGGKGHLRLLQNYSVGLAIEISMDIKTRNPSGILLSIYGKKDFLLLEIYNNTITARMDNGHGPLEAFYKLSNQYLLCDGNWHTLHVYKSRNVITVGVDEEWGQPGFGHGPNTNTRSPIFIGGHPMISRVRGSRSHKNFVGCMRNLKIRKEIMNTPPESVHGDVSIGYCPV